VDKQVVDWMTLKHASDVVPDPSIFVGLRTRPIKRGAARYRVTFDVRQDHRTKREEGDLTVYVWGVVTGIESSFFKPREKAPLLPPREEDVELVYSKQLGEAERRSLCDQEDMKLHILAEMRMATIKAWEEVQKGRSDGEETEG
jgi:hypothetical protein